MSDDEGVALRKWSESPSCLLSTVGAPTSIEPASACRRSSYGLQTLDSSRSARQLTETVRLHGNRKS